MFTHSWEGGTWLDWETSPISPSYRESTFRRLGKSDLYYKYLSQQKLRVVNFRSLTENQISLIRENFADDAKFDYKGCHTAYPGIIVPEENIDETTFENKLAFITSDLFKVKVGASVIQTAPQEYNPKFGWSAYSRDERGSIILDKNTGKSVFTEATPEKITKGVKFRMWPSLYELNKDEGVSVNKIFPGITGYLNIENSISLGGNKYYKVNYPTTKGIKNLFVSEKAIPVKDPKLISLLENSLKSKS